MTPPEQGSGLQVKAGTFQSRRLTAAANWRRSSRWFSTTVPNDPEIRRNNADSFQQPEHVAARLRLAQPLVGHDVRRHVESSLNRELERVLDEALLTHIVGDPLGSSQGPQLPDAGFDESELLGDQLGVGHRRRSAAVPTPERVAG